MRLRAAYRREGARALAHGNRGRRPANAADPQLAKQVLKLAQTTYQGFNRRRLTEQLAEREEIHVSRATVDRWLRAAGVPAARKRRPARAHHRRDRMAQEGCLLQVDGSRHDCLEGRGPCLTLVGGIDAATGLVDGAIFREQEDAQGYFLMLRQVVVSKGVPLALYSDRHGIFVKTRSQEDSHGRSQLSLASGAGAWISGRFTRQGPLAECGGNHGCFRYEQRFAPAVRAAGQPRLPGSSA